MKDRTSLRPRNTVRLLLFNDSNQLLLMKIHNPGVSDPGKPWLPPSYWVTFGGEIEPGEDVVTAARRELLEETGIVSAQFGPAVWYGEQVLLLSAEPRLFKETFIVVRTEEDKITAVGQTPEEKQVIKEMKWWHLDKLEATAEVILPAILPRLIRAIAEGKYPTPVCQINL